MTPPRTSSLSFTCSRNSRSVLSFRCRSAGLARRKGRGDVERPYGASSVCVRRTKRADSKNRPFRLSSQTQKRGGWVREGVRSSSSSSLKYLLWPEAHSALGVVSLTDRSRSQSPLPTTCSSLLSALSFPRALKLTSENANRYRMAVLALCVPTEADKRPLDVGKCVMMSVV